MTSKADADAPIRARLNQALAGVSHSEISRRTGFHVSNVNRYLRDARLPADFVARVTEAFGLNPVWTLAGEGHSRLDSVSGEVTRSAENLLSLVQALRAVMRQRLGALLGDRDKLLLADLNDALAALEKARRELSAQSRPVLKDFLARFQGALVKRDHKAAAALEPALVELSRLSEDEDLRQTLLHLRAGLAQAQGKLPESLDLELRAFLSFPTRVQKLDMPFCTGVHNLILKLDTLGRSREALKVARAARILLEGSGVPPRHVAKLAGLEGMLLTYFFKPARGLPLALSAFAQVEPEFQRDMMWAVRLQAEYLSGLTTLDAAHALAPRQSTSCAMVLLMLAALEQRRDVLASLLAERVGDAVGQTPAAGPWSLHARALLSRDVAPLMAGEERALALGASPDLTRAAWAIRRAHVLAASDKTAAARRELAAAGAARTRMPKHERLHWALQLLFHRMAQDGKLADARMAARARRFFARARRGGCAL